LKINLQMVTNYQKTSWIKEKIHWWKKCLMKWSINVRCSIYVSERLIDTVNSFFKNIFCIISNLNIMWHINKSRSYVI
jgi:hypothetical protein